jgi:hypothetical protein
MRGQQHISSMALEKIGKVLNLYHNKQTKPSLISTKNVEMLPCNLLQLAKCGFKKLEFGINMKRRVASYVVGSSQDGTQISQHLKEITPRNELNVRKCW